MCVVWGKPLGVGVGEGGWQCEDSGWASWCLAQPGEFLNHCGHILTALHFLPCLPRSLLYLAASGILFKMFSQIMFLLCSELLQSPALTKAAESPEFLCPVPLGLRPHCSFLLSFLALPGLLLEQGSRLHLEALGLLLPLPGNSLPRSLSSCLPHSVHILSPCHLLRKALPAHLVKAEHLAVFCFPAFFTTRQVPALFPLPPAG